VDTHVPVYKPRSRNVIQTILKNHFSDFEKHYDDHYADKYGKYRIIRIKQAVEKFIECGDYSKGIARIKCTNPNCGHAMKVISVVTDPGGCTPPLEVNKIMECLKRNNAPPFDKEVTKAS